jgi:enterochelin esterase-like enzyme
MTKEQQLSEQPAVVHPETTPADGSITFDINQMKISGKDTYAYAFADDNNDPYYALGPDSHAQPGVPEGQVERFRFVSQTVYPGIERNYSLYVPAQYDPSNPACLVVFLDGDLYLDPAVNAHRVLDNLINRSEIPVTLALFVQAGERGPGYPIIGGSDNRSIEFDSTDGNWARFLIEELIPEVSDKYALAESAASRVICGISSGGACAFTTAWERSDVFGNVISHCGSFINIRGAHNYPNLIRRTPRKPIRIWHQTGSRDLDMVFGSIPIANHDFAAALEYRRYDHKFIFGNGGHSLKHGGAVLPETLRWIWRDHPDTALTQ